VWFGPNDKQNIKAISPPIKATHVGPYTYKGHPVDAPGSMKNRRDRQMSKKRQFASALDSLGEGGGLPRPLDIRSVVPTTILTSKPNSGVFPSFAVGQTQAAHFVSCSRRLLLAKSLRSSGLPLAKVEGARKRRPAASHARCPTFPLSSPRRPRRRGSGRGGPFLVFRIMDRWGSPRTLSLVDLSHFVLGHSFGFRAWSFLRIWSFVIRHSVPSHHTYRSHLLTLTNTY